MGVNFAASRSTSTARPPAAKLARFQSVQKLCDLDATPSPLRFSTSMNALDRVAADRTQGTAPPPSSFRRFKDKFGKVRGHKIGAEETPVSSRIGAAKKMPYWSDKENAEMNQLARTLSASSVKSKRHNKVSLQPNELAPSAPL